MKDEEQKEFSENLKREFEKQLEAHEQLRDDFQNDLQKLSKDNDKLRDEINELKRNVTHTNNLLDEAAEQHDLFFNKVKNNYFTKIGQVLNKLTLHNWRDIIQLILLNRKTGLFDSQWYKAKYPEARKSKLPALLHYYWYGSDEGYNPNPLLHTRWYYRQYKDVALHGVNPLLHYIKKGAKEERDPSPFFNSRYYMDTYPEVVANGHNPLAHYLNSGGGEGKNPNPFFLSEWYLKKYSVKIDQGENPLTHFLDRGADNGCRPNPYFYSDLYLGLNSDAHHLSGCKIFHDYMLSCKAVGYPACHQKGGLYVTPLISIVLSVQDTTSEYLHDCIQSVLSQHYENWELCISAHVEVSEQLRGGIEDFSSQDSRIKVKLFEEQLDFKSLNNAAADMATGGYIAFLVDTDALTPDALLETVLALNKNNSEVLNSGAWLIDDKGECISAQYKPKNTTDYLIKHGYFAHFLVIKADLFHHIVEQELILENSYYQDLFVKATDETLDVASIPRLLYKKRFRAIPLISIITPVYNVPARYLRKCIDSVLQQQYQNWELCLVDDASPSEHIKPLLEEYAALDSRIKVTYLDENQGISGATNAGAKMATGEYISFLDHDDELTVDALLEAARAVNFDRPDIIYSDEWFISVSGECIGVHYKPDFSPDLLLSHNYITHFLLMRLELFHDVGGLDSSCNGAQDYDLLLKATERTKRISHIPKILYRWRSLETSTSDNPNAKSYAKDAGKLAVENALKRRSISGEVFHGNMPFYYRVKRKLTDTPLVSIIIPFCDQPDYLEKCITSILTRSSYKNYEIFGVNNNSKKNKTFSLMERLLSIDDRVKFIEYNQPFNYSAINNFAVSSCAGDHVVLMNNDIEILNENWLEALLEHSQRPEIGAVGAKLYYPDETIQHAGIILGICGYAGHSHRRLAKDSSGYFNRLCCIQNVSAVTAALLMVKRDLFEEVGGLDEQRFSVACNDVDFCLKLLVKGYLNIFTPFAEAIHYESVSRGYEDTPEKMARFVRETRRFRDIWKSILAKGDPYYNPNLPIDREDWGVMRFLKTKNVKR